MFDQLRKNTKLILWITVVAFIGLGFLGWGLSSGFGGGSQIAPGTIGLVNGKPIDGRAYDLVVQRARENYKQQAGRDPDERTDIQMRTQAWNDLVQEMVLRQEVDRREDQRHRRRDRGGDLLPAAAGVRAEPDVPDQRAVRPGEVPGLPPGSEHSDARCWKSSTARTCPCRNCRCWWRERSRSRTASSGTATKPRTRSIKVEYLMVPGSNFPVDANTVPQADLERYYRAHRQSYQAPAQAVLQYVNIPIRPTQNDSLNLVEQARGILQEYRNGEDFLLLVNDFSEAPPQLRGGDAGAYLTASQIADPEVRAAAFALARGRGQRSARRGDGRARDQGARPQVRPGRGPGEVRRHLLDAAPFR